MITALARAARRWCCASRCDGPQHPVHVVRFTVITKCSGAWPVQNARWPLTHSPLPTLPNCLPRSAQA
ncbi:hypothetical protein IE81DRAFT_8027 [Ceraceosorus guamensis]|uniref:Uncharacterized protein n=1 Tax=Ceraceosorus guamensis TaxID=1522189 RepID=A0A316W931_9BASI|nr:hypothetical protein IE81DRAFT_8027 [Ceraceosorus guamensis]PWN46426.1 hypothetical protein IE81DRAFT_8027 [Ceraceosorus guamensis]